MRTCRLLALLFACAIPSLRAEVALLPLQDGTTWQYAVAQPPAPATRLVVRVAGHEELKGKQLARLETDIDGVLTKTELVDQTERGLLCYQRTLPDEKPTNFDPPLLISPAKFAVGAKWKSDDPSTNNDTPREFSVVGEEEIEVPAGKFHAYHIQSAQPWPVQITSERWFAPGTGLVKAITTTRGPTGRLISRATTLLDKFGSTPAPTRKPTPSPPAPSVTPGHSPVSSASALALAPAAAESPTPIQPVIAFGITSKLQVAKEKDGTPTTQFRSGDPNIFVRWTGDNLPIGSTARLVWLAEDVGEVAEPNFVVDQTDIPITSALFTARFTLSRPKDGWAAGKYRVDLYLDDKLLDSLGVTIVE